MDTLSVAGGTTVIGDYNGSDDLGINTFAPSKSHGKGGRGSLPPQAKFGNAVDYIDQTRPFFVKIGAGGLLEALEKLDKELIAVRVFTFRSGREC